MPDAPTPATATDPAAGPPAAVLDPLTLPLRGTRLIEASAGTGKTWTIAALYLRLVLGHGRAVPLQPSQILVMTFTRAATRELSDRIRDRLVRAAARFRGEPPEEGDDPFLQALLDHWPSGPERDAAAWRLAQAAEAMDEAAVFTIDAWCQRMLREHAFDSGCLFDEELEPDETALRREAVRDYWRQQVYPLQGAVLEAVLSDASDVEALDGSIRRLVGLHHAAKAGGPTLAETIRGVLDDRRQRLARLRLAFREPVNEMRRWIEEQSGRKDKPIHGSKLKPSNVASWFGRLQAWLESDADGLPALTEPAWKRLTPDGIADAIKPSANLEPSPAFATFEQLRPQLMALPTVAAPLRLHAAAQVAARMQAIKSERGRFGFADLLERLDRALDRAVDPDRAQRLRQRILEQYPVALVDEFQDTSALQLRLFTRLHGLGDAPPDTDCASAFDAHSDGPAGRALLLIGDPKQAIYAFRGAEIGSYLQARQATQGRHHRLDTNRRSTQGLVRAVNGLFERAEARPGGAFLHGQPGGGHTLPFVPVEAHGRPETLRIGCADAPPIVLTLDATMASDDAHRQRFAGLAAEAIVELLNEPKTGFVDPAAPEPFRRLKPADIAVLVRQRQDAQAVQRELRRRGVASVYLSEADSVFASIEAHDVLRWLEAVAAPRDTRRIRAALATATRGLSLAELARLAEDEVAFDAQCEPFTALMPVWQAQGVLAMLRRALHDWQLPGRWLAQAEVAEGGERRMTNLLHLAELLQAASTRLEGPAALIRWLTRQIEEAGEGVGRSGAGAGPAGAEPVLRLESDADLVKVVTLHKSKGLEYPVVFLPFACRVRPQERRHIDFVAVGGEGAVSASGGLQGEAGRIEFEPDDAQMAALEEERLREDLRLLYVALTRARHHLWIGAAALQRGPSKESTWHRSAFGCLLTGTDATPEDLPAAVQAAVSDNPGVRVVLRSAGEPPDRVWVTPIVPRGGANPLAESRPYTGSFPRDWAISSFTALVRRAGAAPTRSAAASAVRPLREDEPADAATPAERLAAAPAPSGLSPVPLAAVWHRFPRGAYAGNFLHGELEWLAGEGFALADSPALQQALKRRCARTAWGPRQAEVLQWLSAVCERELPSLGVSLRGLERVLPEMEFWFPSDGLKAEAIDALCRQHILPGQPRPALPARQLSGLLMGFADLVFEHAGACGVLDYKSNALGPDDGAYTEAALARAVLDNRYDVQAAVYLLALHRLLRDRLGSSYEPSRDLHGAVYLFLRGVGSAGAGAWHLPPPVALLEALDRLLPALPQTGEPA